MNPTDLDDYTTGLNDLVTTLKSRAQGGQVLAVDEVIAELEPLIDDEDVEKSCWGMIVVFAIALQRLVLDGP